MSDLQALKLNFLLINTQVLVKPCLAKLLPMDDLMIYVTVPGEQTIKKSVMISQAQTSNHQLKVTKPTAYVESLDLLKSSGK